MALVYFQRPTEIQLNQPSADEVPLSKAIVAVNPLMLEILTFTRLLKPEVIIATVTIGTA